MPRRIINVIASEQYTDWHLAIGHAGSTRFKAPPEGPLFGEVSRTSGGGGASFFGEGLMCVFALRTCNLTHTIRYVVFFYTHSAICY